MKSNQYFNIDCVYDECPDPAAKRGVKRDRHSEGLRANGVCRINETVYGGLYKSWA